jgi:NAD(P)-dependent dehydrogenase (short-subunit alcohol dehydrogenase family)
MFTRTTVARRVLCGIERRSLSAAAVSSDQPVCVISGGTKGIGLHLGNQFLNKHPAGRLFLLGRTPPDQPTGGHFIKADVTNEKSLQAAYAQLTTQNDVAHADYLISTVGMLQRTDLKLPERSLRDLSFDGMAHTLLTNTIGPALFIAKFAPLVKTQGGWRREVKKQPPVVVALSARVGSLTDNGTGGWSSYRASKAALNMYMLNFAHELGFGPRPKASVVILHPGTVDTNLSKPFQAAAAKRYTIQPVEQSAGTLLELIEGIDHAADNGKFYDYNKKLVPW